MGTHFRLKPQAIPSWLIVGVACAGCGEQADLGPFLGDWTYGAGMATGTCEGLVSNDLEGIEARVERRSESSIEYIAGEACHIVLEVDGSVASTRRASPCELTVGQVISTGGFDTFSLTVGEAGTLQSFGVGSAELTIKSDHFQCEHFDVSGTLHRKEGS